MTTRHFVASIFIAVSVSAYGQSFSFELFALDANGPRLMGAGTIDSSVKETTVTRWPRDPYALDKELSLRNGFTVGLSDHEDAQLTGIGFWLKRVPSPMEASQFPGFSWEWFDLSKENIFEKRKGAGRIRITTAPIGGRTLVESVEFLDDITFQLNAKEGGAPGTYTHEVHIKKGSGLSFQPQPKEP